MNKDYGKRKRQLPLAGKKKKIGKLLQRLTGHPPLTMAIGTGIALLRDSVIKRNVIHLRHLATAILAVPVAIGKQILSLITTSDGCLF